MKAVLFSAALILLVQSPPGFAEEPADPSINTAAMLSQVKDPAAPGATTTPVTEEDAAAIAASSFAPGAVPHLHRWPALNIGNLR